MSRKDPFSQDAFNKPFCYRILPIYPSGRRALFGGLLIYWRYWCDKKPSGHPSSACQSRWEDGILSSTPIILPTPPERTDGSGWGRCEAIFRKSLTKCKAPRSKKNEKKKHEDTFRRKNINRERKFFSYRAHIFACQPCHSSGERSTIFGPPSPPTRSQGLSERDKKALCFFLFCLLVGFDFCPLLLFFLPVRMMGNAHEGFYFCFGSLILPLLSFSGGWDRGLSSRGYWTGESISLYASVSDGVIGLFHLVSLVKLEINFKAPRAAPKNRTGAVSILGREAEGCLRVYVGRSGSFGDRTETSCSSHFSRRRFARLRASGVENGFFIVSIEECRA